MITLTVNTKGQVTLGEDFLKHLGIAPGSKVVIEKLSDGRLQIRAAPQGRISDVFGALRRRNRSPLPLDQIKDVARRGWTGKR